MQYHCESCGKTEIIWNSRDGVTPFIVRCFFCKGEAKHINWDQDRRVVDFTPQPGTRIFRDKSKEDYLKSKKNYLEENWGERLQKVYETKEKALEALSKGWKEGLPECYCLK